MAIALKAEWQGLAPGSGLKIPGGGAIPLDRGRSPQDNLVSIEHSPGDAKRAPWAESGVPKESFCGTNVGKERENVDEIL
jgi:hypothetical protein